MGIFKLVFKEIKYRKKDTIVTLLFFISIFVFLLFPFAGRSILDFSTQINLNRLEKKIEYSRKELYESSRKGTLKFSYNLVFTGSEKSLDQWKSKGYSSEYFGQDIVDKLSALVEFSAVRHLLPVLQLKGYSQDAGISLYVAGIGSEFNDGLGKKPLVAAVEYDKCILGASVAEAAGVGVGDFFKFIVFERNNKTEISAEVQSINEKRGNRDDYSVFVQLDSLQSKCSLDNRINAIFALECICSAGYDYSFLEKAGQTVLPGLKVVFMSKKAADRSDIRYGFQKGGERVLSAYRQQSYDIKQKFNKVASIVSASAFGLIFALLPFFAGFIVSSRKKDYAALHISGLSGQKIFLINMLRYSILLPVAVLFAVVLEVVVVAVFAGVMNLPMEVYSNVFGVISFLVPVASGIAGLMVFFAVLFLYAVKIKVDKLIKK